MPKPKKQPTKYRVGDWVTYFMWPERALAKVIEVRGPFGTHGEIIYGLRAETSWGEVQEFEQAESELQPAPTPTPSK